MIRLLSDILPAESPMPHFEQHLPAAIPMWLVWLGAAGAITLIILLYRAQRRLASPLIILALMALRVAVLLLVLLIMLQPSLVWTHITKSPGTLWLVLDQSGSMGLRDPQSSELERLRWADALGLLPEAKRKSKPDVLAARALALGRLADSLHPTSTYESASPEMEAADREAFLDSMRDLHKRILSLADDIESDAAVNSQSPLAANMRNTAGIVDDGIAKARGVSSLRAAVNGFRWDDLATALRIDTRTLTLLADRLDTDYLRVHASDSALQAALARITGQSRAELVTQLLTADERKNGPLSKLLGQFRTRIVSFADAPQNVGEPDLSNPDQMIQSTLVPAGKSTNIASALEFVGEQLAPDEKASVLLVTDSRQNVPGEPSQAAAILARHNVHVFGLLIGSQQLSLDAAAEQVNVPDWIYKDDTLDIAAAIRLDGMAGKTTTLELRRGNTLLSTQTLRADSNRDTKTVRLKDRPGEPGVYDYEIRVAEVPGEVNTSNNHLSFRVAVKKDKLSALLIEDVPRWEYQYVSSVLTRDQRMKVQTVLFTPPHIDRVTLPPPVKASPTNPQTTAQILPETREEWQAFDVIFLGDVTPEQLPAAQQQFLATAVRDRGTTLIITAGPRAMPTRYADSPLADLLPVTMTSDWSADDIRRHLYDGFKPGIAPQGVDSVLSQLGLDPSANTQAWNNMPPWYWHSELTHAKDAATVLWTITDPGSKDTATPTLEWARKNALLSTMTVGRGRVLYLAADQTWRLRQIQTGGGGGGDNLQERFWGQVIRWATGTSLPAGGRFVRFGAEPQHATQGTPITVTARIFHEDLTPYNGVAFDAVATTKAGKVIDHVAMHESPNDPGTYRGTFAGLPSGELDITVEGAEVQRLLDTDPTVLLRSVGIQIEPQLNLELRNVDTNPELLNSIAAAGNGIALNGPYADVIASFIPTSPIVRTTTHQVGLFTDPKSPGTTWTHWLALSLFVLLLAAEWALRKRAGMV